jgi:hypothetical protein
VTGRYTLEPRDLLRGASAIASMAGQTSNN